MALQCFNTQDHGLNLPRKFETWQTYQTHSPKSTPTNDQADSPDYSATIQHWVYIRIRRQGLENNTMRKRKQKWTTVSVHQETLPLLDQLKLFVTREYRKRGVFKDNITRGECIQIAIRSEVERRKAEREVEKEAEKARKAERLAENGTDTGNCSG